MQRKVETANGLNNWRGAGYPRQSYVHGWCHENTAARTIIHYVLAVFARNAHIGRASRHRL